MKAICLSLLTFLSVLSLNNTVSAQQKTPKLGIASSLSQDSLVYAAGFKLITESVKKMLSPALTADEFNNNLEKIKAAKCKVLTCNVFFPADIKIAGPDVDEAKVLTYAEGVLSRAKQAGVKYIVLGSSGARSIPADYDVGKAKADFVKLCKKLGEIAGKYQVLIVLENLQSSETNFLNSLKSAAEIVRKVNHPNFRLNADIFHMMREGDLPEEIIAAGDVIAFVEVAEKETRSLPGVKGDDFKPYLNALKQINYKGYLFIEGSVKNAAVEIPAAFKYLSAQINEVYLGK
ncbi:sugar phosphate isomerase/epimerase [Pedobacter frigiditerrae]|uniref:Sugar phosphate isomerase/epimerase n=1 Tax=Pedobacter frigiditerrae TaxID=2530452 RepID=A0A4R0MMR6_9SPHI|nr:sugar phosphate isomerase/epimerase family protein [Pedobacter frigiditerrae]TCC87274.1 sugar phosphate isomerase/epimerase [Pedobacter frigiditerrae]